MADMEQDKDVARRYRELGREEPPPTLDARIRAEARSALETHAAPLVPPTGRRRWYFPVAAAAVVMLAVAVAMQVEREQPAEQIAAAPEVRKDEVKKEVAAEEKQRNQEATVQPQPAQADALTKRPEPRPFAEAPKMREMPAEPSAGARSREDFSRDNRARQDRPAASPPAAPSTRAPASASATPPAAASADAAPQRNVQAEAASGALARSKVAEAPDAWLERIARLRAEGRNDEADKQLEAFRKQYPDYKIPPETLKKVERPGTR